MIICATAVQLDVAMKHMPIDHTLRTQKICAYASVSVIVCVGFEHASKTGCGMGMRNQNTSTKERASTHKSAHGCQNPRHRKYSLNVFNLAIKLPVTVQPEIQVSGWFATVLHNAAGNFPVE